MNIGDISVNTNFALSQYLSARDGLTENAIMSVQDRVNITAEDLLQAITNDKIGFLSLLENTEMVKEIKALAAKYQASSTKIL
jgi:hypothetical protein